MKLVGLLGFFINFVVIILFSKGMWCYKYCWVIDN